MMPRRALTVLALSAVVIGLAGPTAANAASATTVSASEPAISGTLLVAHGDGGTNGAMVMQAELQTASGSVPLDLPSSAHEQVLALAGSRVEVQGSRVTPLASGSAATAHATTFGSARSLRVAVVLLRLPGSAAEPVSKATMQSSMFGATKSVANWYSQMSGGQVAVSGTVFGYFGGVRSCDLATELSAGAAAAAQSGYVAADYDSLVVYTPNQGCDFSGMGWIGANGVFLNGNATPAVIEHELGHNLGLRHAGAYACGTVAVSLGCLSDYGDTTDIMGDPTPNRGLSAEHKYMLGWIPASEVRTVTSGTQTISLTASENPLAAGSIVLIHVRAADGTLFAIDRRASVGYDAGISGVWIRQVASFNTDDTELVGSGSLAAGETYTDARKVTVTTLSDSGKTASIRVCVGPCAVPVTALSRAAAITARNVVTGAKTSAKNASINLTVPSGHGVAAGHTVIVAAHASSAAGPVSCADSRGNVYAVNVNNVGQSRLIVCSARAVRGLTPGTTISIKYPAFNGASGASANDFSGIRATSRADKLSVRSATSGTINSGTTPRTTHSVELVFGVVIHRGTASFKAASGYKPIGAVAFRTGAARVTINPEFKVVSAAGSYKFGGTLSSAQQWRAAVITFVAT